MVLLVPVLLLLLCLQLFDLKLAVCMTHTASLFAWEVQTDVSTAETIAVNLIMFFFLLLCMAVFLGIFLFFEDLDKTGTIHPTLTFRPLITRKWDVIKLSVLFLVFLFLLLLIFNYVIFKISFPDTYHMVIAAILIALLYLMKLILCLAAAVVALCRISISRAIYLSFVSIIKHPLTWIIIALIFSVFHILIFYSAIRALSFLIKPVFLALIYCYYKRILRYERCGV